MIERWSVIGKSKDSSKSTGSTKHSKIQKLKMIQKWRESRMDLNFD